MNKASIFLIKEICRIKSYMYTELANKEEDIFEQEIYMTYASAYDVIEDLIDNVINMEGSYD